jgi:predicted RNA-binding protein YlqC (UPF0109 family)
VKDDLAILKDTFRAGNKYAELVEKLVDLGIKQYAATHAGEIPPDVANACTNILRAIGKWTGAEVNRSVTTHVSTSTNEVKGMFVEFNKLVGRKRKSWDAIRTFIESCPDDEEVTLCLP